MESDAGGAPAVPPERRNADRLLVCINANAPAAREIIRKTARLADRFGAAAWYVLYVQPPAEAADRIGLAEQRRLLQNFQLATKLGGQVLRVKSGDVVLAITPPDGGEALHYRLTAHDIVSFSQAKDRLEFVGYILALHNVSDYKKLDQVKSNFLATVSHELKTPLASIGLSLKLLADERVGADERQRTVAGMRQETQRLQKMVAELLDVARLDAGGTIPLDVRAVSVAEVTARTTPPITAQLAQKQLTLAQDLPPDLPAVRADAEKAAWVLLNLLVNAIRYSPTGGTVQLTVRAESDFVRFSVQDDGPGIAPEHHARIFQRFNSILGKATYAGGSGLGLSIAREFIEAQGGRLWVESEPGAGSTFCFTLPVA